MKPLSKEAAEEYIKKNSNLLPGFEPQGDHAVFFCERGLEYRGEPRKKRTNNPVVKLLPPLKGEM